MKRILAACCAVIVGVAGLTTIGTAAGAAVPADPMAPVVTFALPPKPTEEAALLMEKASVDMMDHPAESAGSWWDAGSKKVILGTKGNTSAAFGTALDGYTAQGAQVMQRKRSFDDLQQVIDAVMKLPEIGGVRANQASIDWSANRVNVGLRPITDEARVKLAKMFGDAVAVEDTAPAHQQDGLDRYRDRGPYTGGAAWGTVNQSTENRCTTAFPMKRPDNSKRFMVTAGHCNVPARPAYTGNTAGTTWTVLIGTAVGYANSLCPGTFESCEIGTTKYGDISIIRVAGNQPKIYSGGQRATAKADIASEQTGHPAVGDSMCLSGSTTGSHCGFYVTNNFTAVRYRDDEIVQPVVRTRMTTGRCSEGGDSGGAIYKPVNGDARASGVLSGGSGNPLECDMFYTSIYYAQRLFAAETVTTANP